MEDEFFDKDLLISLIDGLGFFSEDTHSYQTNKDTLDCLKDVERFLRLDFEDKKQALLTVGKCNVVTRNLLPLLKTFPHDEELVYHTLKVIVLMTMPPKEGEHPQAVLDVLHETKAAFTERTSLAIVTSLCLDALKDLPDMSDEQYKILQLFLTFVKNLMLIPDSRDSGTSVSKHHYATLQVDFLKAAFEENVLDIVGCILQHIDSKKLREDAPVALDIIYGVYLPFDPRAVFDADLQDAVQRHRAQQPQQEAPNRINVQKRSSPPSRSQPPHPTIAHMAIRKPASKQSSAHPGVKLVSQSGEQAYYIRSTPGMLGHTVLKNAAKTKAATKVHATVNASNVPRTKSSTSYRQLLASVKAYTTQLLCGPLDSLIYIIRDEASLGLHIGNLESRSFLHFFWLSAWFMQFLRHQDEARIRKSSRNAESKAIEPSTSVYAKLSSVISWRMIQTVVRVWLDVADTDGKQKKAADWRLQEVALKALRELITFLDMAYHYGSDSDKRKAEQLETQLLQDDTKEAGVLNRVLQSMRQFKKHDKKVPRQEGRESRGYAVDMVKMLHIVLRVYERICKSGFVLQREPVRAGAEDQASEDEHEDEQGAAQSEDEPQRGSTPGGEKGISDSDPGAERHAEGHGEDVDGTAGPSPEETGSAPVEKGDASDKEGPDEERERALEDEMSDDGETAAAEGAAEEKKKSTGSKAGLFVEDAREGGSNRKQRETRVDFDKVLRMASHVDVIELYLFLLQRYKTLDAQTLHAITSFLTRVCDKLNLEPMLYQICYLKQFHMILSDEEIQDKSSFRGILKFGRRMVTHLLARLDPKPVTLDKPTEMLEGDNGKDLDAVLDAFPADKQKEALQEIQSRITNVMFVELLFAKGPREADMINREYNWQRAVQRKMSDLGYREPVQQGAAKSPGLGQSSDEQDDGVPDVGAARTEEEKAAAKRAAQLASTGLSEEELETFTSMFEAMNGRQALRMLLLEDWNSQQGQNLTPKDLKRVMSALNLKQGVMTTNQEKKLAELVEEFSLSGKQAHKLIANALPGGFSVVAIKKNMARLGLRVSGQSNQPAGSDGSDNEGKSEEDEDEFERDADRSAAVELGELGDLDEDGNFNKRSVPPKQRKRSKTVFDAITKQRSAAGNGPDDAHELQDDLEDLHEDRIADRVGVQSERDDDLGEGPGKPSQSNRVVQKQGKQQPKHRLKKDHGKAPTPATKAKKQSQKQALATALEELTEEAQAQFLLEGSNPAEEEVLEMQSVGTVLEALGLCYVDDADDPRVWCMVKGSVKPQTAVQALCKLLSSAKAELSKKASSAEPNRVRIQNAAAAPTDEGMEDDLEDDMGDPIPAAQLAASSVPADLLDDSDEDGPPAALKPDDAVAAASTGGMQVDDDSMEDRAGGPSAERPRHHLQDSDDSMDEGEELTVQQPRAPNRPQLLDDEEGAGVHVEGEPPVEAVSADDDAARSMHAPEDSDEQLAEPSANAMGLSSMDQAALALEDTLPTPGPESLTHDLGSAALVEVGVEGDLPHIPSSATTQCASDLAIPTEHQQQLQHRAVGLHDSQSLPPNLIGTEASQILDLAALPQTEQSQIAHTVAALHDPGDCSMPGAPAMDAVGASQRGPEDPESQWRSDQEPAVLAPSSKTSQEELPDVRDRARASLQREDGGALKTQVSAAVDIPSAVTQQSVALPSPRAGDGQGASPRKRTLAQEQQCCDPDRGAALGSCPGAQVDELLGPSVAPPHEEQPRTKKARLEAMPSQNPSPQHEENTLKPSSQAAAQPSLREPSPAAATPPAVFPLSEAQHSAKLASQVPPVDALVISSPVIQSPSDEPQQENKAVQPGQPVPEWAVEHVKCPRTLTARPDAIPP